ncbi:ABC transporter ATP-binding protein [Geodermatophilus sp. TF02-6]|nr:ABC transporter ATP-binding protein [Geodermatophilus sp. TF02-6]
MTVRRNEVVGVLGANGAGKTTLLRAIAGVVRPQSGAVVLHGRTVTGLPDHAMTRAGVGHVPSGRELFPQMSVEDNLAMGAIAVDAVRAAELRTRVLDLFPALGRMLERRAGALSGGEQQMLAFGRALMTDPTLLLLDEPSTGLAPAIVAALFDALRQLIAEGGMSVILVEQNAGLALQVVERAFVLRQGRIVLSGPAAELGDDADLVAAYLGA